MDAEFLRYRYEDGYKGVVVKDRFRVGVRHLQMVYMFVCAVVLGAMRGSTGVAVIAMADVTRRNDTYIQIHDWDRGVQGKILSSFFFGYALMLIPAEMYLRRFGGKLVLTVVLIVNGALSVTMPTIANRGGRIAVYNAQLWLGMTQACLTPANQELVARWLPPNERGVFSCFIHAGVLLGIIIALPMSGLLSEARLGWELVFYSQAMLTVSMAIVWTLLTASAPDQHQAVGDTEKEYIRETLGGYRKKVLQIPWRNILKSRQFWAVAFAHSASNAMFVFYLVDVPTFMHAFRISMRDTGWQTMLPFVSVWLAYVTSAPSVDWVCRILHVSFHFNITYFRKSINALGAMGVTIGLTCLSSLAPGRSWLVVTVLTMVLGSLGFQLSGFLENLKDISQNYCGTLLMLSSAVASAVGALIPMTIGCFLEEDQMDTGQWRVVFLSLAVFYMVCNVVYTILASSDRQEWDGGAVVKTRFIYQNRVMDSTQIELEELSATKPNQYVYSNETDI